MRYATVCSGIEAPSVAWEPLGWEAQWFSEIEAFPSAVLAHHYLGVPNLGDMESLLEKDLAGVDVFCGGTPCQSFSVAGLRGGMDDPRGNLAAVFCALAGQLRPRWVVWENVPGVLSSNGGRDFGSILGALAELGYGLAYRVLDAQYFGLAQRRKRVFVVGYLGDWRRAAAVLFESESMRGDPPPSRESGERVAATLTRGAESRGKGGYAGRRQEDDVNVVVSPAIKARDYKGPSSDGDGDGAALVVSHALKGEGFDASEDGTGRGTPLVPEPYTLAIRGRGGSHNLETRQDGTSNAILTPNGGRAGIGVGAVAFHNRQDPDPDPDPDPDVSHPLGAKDNGMAVAFHENQRAELSLNATVGALNQTGGKPGQGYPAIQQGMCVRRLTPTECERLQGFPDGYTDIPYRGKPAKDGPRYKALGNSMAVPVMQWIGRRIMQAEQGV